MSEGRVTLEMSGPVARIVFDRPAAHNAMTWAMYGELEAHCRQLRDAGVGGGASGEGGARVVRLEGAGGQAFVAGTDIAQFQSFTTGDHGVAYEKRIDECIGLLAALPMPTVAVVDGWCMGGGLAIASACDFRIASNRAKFGVPIAKTVGNCLSMANVARLVARLGRARVERMLLLAEVLSVQEAHAAGFVLEVVEPAALPAAADALCARLSALAPLTQYASKAALEGLLCNNLPEDIDLIRRCYGSADFREGVAAFVGKRAPVWRNE